MDEETEQAIRRHLATTVMNRPFGQLPENIFPKLSIESAMQMVTEGIAKARQLDADIRAANESWVLVHIAKAVSDGAILPEAEKQILTLLQRQPELCGRVPAEPETMQFVLANCPDIFEYLVAQVDSAERRSEIVSNSIVSPLTVGRHNALVKSVIGFAGQLSSAALLKYLDAIEATCRLQQKSDAQAYYVRSSCRLFHIAISENASLVDDIFIQLSSFCLSFLRIKAAADLYKSLVELRPK
ncbi:hypothetical protein GGI15_001964 [Coemansia interrupta]|uniref:CCR4-NOT transcription complex subunit 11 n=1 Tax=Coemansia interrupta TaxID=1126814 RepID=A0A9W8HN46_9FUNG|nr:hypothetical protein GGI15_001964 [Coemansia interrupta]